MMSADWPGPRTSRRDFLRLVGGTLGGVVLSHGYSWAHGGGGGGHGARPLGAPPLPNGYRFFSILTPGVRDFGLPLADVNGGVMINDHAEILFHAENARGGFGVYALTMDYSGAAPVVAGARAVIEAGDPLPGGRTVERIRRGASNAEGSFAAVIQTDETPGVYFQRERGPFEPLIQFLDPLPKGEGQYGAAFGDIDLHDKDDLLVVAHFVAEDQDAEIGLFHLPGAQDSDVGELIIQTGDLIPHTETPIVNFGLMDLDDDGQYIAQLAGRVPRRRRHRSRRRLAAGGAAEAGQDEGVSAIIQGNVKAPAARASMTAGSRRLPRAPTPVRGECVYGPRVGDGDTACTIHRNGTVQVLTLNSLPITRSNDRSPLGAVIRGISAPVLGADGLVYYLLITHAGLELCMANGVEERTILVRGDRIDGLPVDAILHAFHSDQADDAGRIVFTVEFEGGQNSIILGLPV
jgi:hypothetical protein